MHSFHHCLPFHLLPDQCKVLEVLSAGFIVRAILGSFFVIWINLSHLALLLTLFVLYTFCLYSLVTFFLLASQFVSVRVYKHLDLDSVCRGESGREKGGKGAKGVRGGGWGSSVLPGERQFHSWFAP